MTDAPLFICSGPGGQNVNKVNTRMTLGFYVANLPSLSDHQKELIRNRLPTRINREGVLRVVSQKHRTQALNRDATIERFVSLLRESLQEALLRKKKQFREQPKNADLMRKSTEAGLRKGDQILSQKIVEYTFGTPPWLNVANNRKIEKSLPGCEISSVENFMNRNENVKFLELNNGYCECPELTELFSLRKKCELFIEMDKIEELRRFVLKYDAKLSVLLSLGKLEAVLHKGPGFSSECKIPILQIGDHNTDENVITVHCPKCGQQIDVVE